MGSGTNFDALNNNVLGIIRSFAPDIRGVSKSHRNALQMIGHLRTRPDFQHINMIHKYPKNLHNAMQQYNPSPGYNKRKRLYRTSNDSAFHMTVVPSNRYRPNGSWKPNKNLLNLATFNKRNKEHAQILKYLKNQGFLIGDTENEQPKLKAYSNPPSRITPIYKTRTPSNTKREK